MTNPFFILFVTSLADGVTESDNNIQPDSGLPFGTRVTEEGAIRVTEEGDIRVIE